jgi:hypothetical protein
LSEGGAVDLLARWRAEWPGALEAWSAYTLLREPRFLESQDDARKDGMAGEIAAIRLRDHAVMVNTMTVREYGLEDDARAILAHEIGHHVYVPGSLTDNARMLAAMTRMFTGLPRGVVAMCANLYSDLLINDRLQRRAGVDIAAVYVKLAARARTRDGGATSEAWKVYTRAYEHLFRAPAGTIAPAEITPEMDADAMLVARIVRSFGGDWLRGSRRFATVMFRYFAADEEAKKGHTFEQLGLGDTKGAGKPPPGGLDGDTVPDGLTSIDPSELDDEDGFDADLDDPLGEHRQGSRPTKSGDNVAPAKEGGGTPGRNYRQPYEYGQILRALGLDLSDHEVTMRYYRERALPHLVPFPARRQPRATEPLAEGYEEWEAGAPLEALDTFGSVMISPKLIPGITTVQRVYGETPGAEPAMAPLDLDIYVDCSGSMPNPGSTVSYLALAGAILALSALRAGARVQATLWSGAGQFETSGGFIRDEKRLLGIVTGYIAGGTAFPLHVLRDTYASRKPSDPRAHIVVISDDGADTMLAQDEKLRDGESICVEALAKGRGGGTLVLNLADASTWGANDTMQKLGFKVHAVRDWEHLVRFARAFVRETYAQ